MRDTFGPRTYLVGQILAGLMATPEGRLDKPESAADYAIQLADLTIHKMGQHIVHPWEKTDAAISSTTIDQDDATL